MYDAVTGDFLKIYSKEYQRFIELTEKAGFDSLGTEIELFAKGELAAMASFQKSLPPFTIESDSFNSYNNLQTYFDELSGIFRINSPSAINNKPSDHIISIR